MIILNREHLNREQVTQLKGIAIVAIALHNYFHLIFTKTKENEMDFDPNRFEYFLSSFVFSPSEWVQSTFTYFGHFGVQIFIFLSAYALAISYPNIDSGYRFLTSRIKKLYPIFVTSILVWLVLWGLRHGIRGPYWLLLEHYGEIFQILTGLYTLIPGNGFPVVGPWWFISYIIQFYLMWILLSRLSTRVSNRALLAVILAGVAFNYSITPFVLDAFRINLLLTPLGHLPEIILGVYYARTGISTSRLLFFGAWVTLAFSGLYYSAWPLHNLSALLTFLYLSVKLIDSQQPRLSALLNWLGAYSLPIFLINGFFRLPFIKFAKANHAWWIDILIGLLFFGVVCIAAYLISKSLNWTMRAIATRVTNR